MQCADFDARHGDRLVLLILTFLSQLARYACECNLLEGNLLSSHLIMQAISSSLDLVQQGQQLAADDLPHVCCCCFPGWLL